MIEGLLATLRRVVLISGALARLRPRKAARDANASYARLLRGAALASMLCVPLYAMGCSQPPAGSAPAGSPAPAGSQLSETQPAQLGTAALTTGGTCSLDRLDGAAAPKESASQPQNRAAVSVSGWGADVQNGLAPVSTYFVLRAASGDLWFAPAAITQRPDVAQHYGVPGLAASGYETVFDASPAPDGQYDVDLAMQFAGGSLLCNTGLKMQLGAGGPASQPAGSQPAGSQPPAGSAPAGSPAPAGSQLSETQPAQLGTAALTTGGTCSLDRLDGAAAPKESASQPQNRAAVAVSGWGADVQNGLAPVSTYFVLRGASGDLWFAPAAITQRPDVAQHYGVPGLAASGYETVFDASPAPDGQYDVDLAMQFASGSLLCNTGLKMQLGAGGPANAPAGSPAPAG